MSDLIGGGPASSANNGQTDNYDGLSRPQIIPPTTGSPSGVRGPRDIMRERNLREARKKEQQEKTVLEKARAEKEARLLEEERRKSAERRANAAAGAANPQRGSGETGPRLSGGTTGQRFSDNSQRSERRSGDPNQPLQGVGRGGAAIGGDATGGIRSRPTRTPQSRPEQGESSRTKPILHTQEAQEIQLQPQGQTGQPTVGNYPGQSTRPGNAQGGPVPGLTAAEQAGHEGANATRSSFPHAFERWETLSAHWEGLTSFWIRRLEENSREISRDPLSAQLSRQVTDLSAAGANLFHAVVELQRLRASSERKFQRWFFETRAEQERFQEIQALSTNGLEEERLQRSQAVQRAEAAETKLANAEKQLAEKNRELQISKEEARRAWEELGRRELEDHERTISLRDGQPTMLGGVQVVPMMQGVPSRHGSSRDRPATRDGYGGQSSQAAEGPADDSDLAYQQYSRSQRADQADPFIETRPIVASPEIQGAPSVTSSGGGYSQAPAVQPASTSAFYQQAGTTLHPVEPERRYGPGGSEILSEEGDEEYEIDATGDFIRDDKGNRVRYRAPVSDDDTDEYDVTAEREREIANMQRYGQVSSAEYGRGSTAPTSRPQVVTSRPAATEPDYAGQGYGSGPGWEAVPRHHHPTRLSDVLEEDERSRTSASQVSRRD